MRTKQTMIGINFQNDLYQKLESEKNRIQNQKRFQKVKLSLSDIINLKIDKIVKRRNLEDE
jgi:hypothetical protein